jgi:uncharacterized membrane protein YqjE
LSWASQLRLSSLELHFASGEVIMIEPDPTETARHRLSDHDRSLGSIVAEIKGEAQDFFNTRVQLVKTEFKEALGAVKVALPLSVIAIALVCTGFLLFTVAAVVLVASAFAGHAYAWFVAPVIVGFLWICLGGVAAFFAYNVIRSRGRFPRRTVEVLKADKMWLQTEARSHS